MANLSIKGSEFFVSFPYNVELINVIKTIPGRQWSDQYKAWKMPATRDNYKSICSLLAPEQSDAVRDWAGKNIKDYSEVNLTKARIKELEKKPKDYKFKTLPFKHQTVGFNLFKDAPCGALFFEMGLGKTKVVLDIICYKVKKNLAKKILYVCPNSILENTVREFNLHAPLSSELEIALLVGSREKKLKLLGDNAINMYVANYEGLLSIREELMRMYFDIIVLDESTRIKNPQAKCSKVLHGLARFAKNRFIMSGTPITQDAIDIYSQYKFLDPSIFGASYWAFKAQYAIMGGWQNKEIVGYHNLDDLQQKVFSIALRYTKRECLDLPEKIYEVKRFDLNDEEQKLYSQIKENILLEVGDKHVTTSIMITKMLKLTQITSGFLRADGGDDMLFKSSSKLKLLKETLEDIMPKKVIIWCNFIANIKQIAALLDSMKIKHVDFYGDVAQKDRQGLIDQFMEDDSCKVFIGQIRTGGMGINLTAASYVIYYTNTYSLQDRLQSEDRAHRIGQTKNVTYIDLVARKTIDESFITILSKKLNFSQLIIDRFKEIVDGEVQ